MVSFVVSSGSKSAAATTQVSESGRPQQPVEQSSVDV